MDMILNLYSDCQLVIISFLDINAYINLKKTCRWFNRLDVSSLQKIEHIGDFIMYTFLGQLHNLCGPALIKTCLDFNKSDDLYTYKNRIEYYRYGKLHKEDGPAIVAEAIWHVYGINYVLHTEFILNQKWYRHGIPYRDDNKPVSISASLISAGKLLSWKDVPNTLHPISIIEMWPQDASYRSIDRRRERIERYHSCTSFDDLARLTWQN